MKDIFFERSLTVTPPSENSTTAVIGTISNDTNKHLQVKNIHPTMISDPIKTSFTDLGYSKYFSSGFPELSVDYASLTHSKGNPYVFNVPEGVYGMLLTVLYKGTGDIYADVAVNIKFVIAFLKEASDGTLATVGTSYSKIETRLTDYGEGNSVTYVTGTEPSTINEHHLCSYNSKAILPVMGATHIAVLPTEISYNEGNMLYDIEYFPVFINSSLRDNNQNDSFVMIGYYDKLLFNDRQQAILSGNWPVITLV